MKLKYYKNKAMFNKKTYITILFFLLFFLSFPFKSYAEFEGVGAGFENSSGDGKNIRIHVSNTGEKYSKGNEINVSFVVYQCRIKEILEELGTHWCAGNSEDYVAGSREDINFSIALPGPGEGDLVIEKSFSKGFNCGRIQVDLVPDPQPGGAIYGGKEFPFNNDCAPPPTPTLIPTPTIDCTQIATSPSPGRACSYPETCSVSGKVGIRTCTGVWNSSNQCVYTPAICQPNCTTCQIITPTPTGRPTATPTQPSIPTRVISATPTPTGVPVVTPTATPTLVPDFNNAMCKCDGIEPSGLIQGQKAVINTFGRVEGTDITKAQITSMTYNFGVASVKDPNKVKPLITPVQIPAVIDRDTSSSSKVRYKTSFEFIVPTPPANNPLYRVWTEIKCTKKTTAALSNPSQIVLGNSIQRNTGLFGAIRDAVLSVSTTIQTKISDVLGLSTNIQKSLQLAPIYPAQVEGDYCSSFWYQFKNP